MQRMSGSGGAVATCHVIECSYNMRDCCHAPNIEVGDQHPACDTFTTQGARQLQHSDSRVGGCKVQQCHFNNSMSCNAPGITVEYHGSHADCDTYRPE